MDKNAWDDVCAKGRKILNDVITQCVLEGSIDQENAQKYFRSGKYVSIAFLFSKVFCILECKDS